MELSKDQAVKEIPNFCFPDINTIQPMTDYSRYACIYQLVLDLVQIVHNIMIARVVRARLARFSMACKKN